MSADLKQIGERIRNRRKQLNLTQEQLAEKMDVSIQMVSNLERGNKAIKIENLLKLSEILNISVDYILRGSYHTDDVQSLVRDLSRLSESDYKMVEMLIAYCLQKQSP